MKILVLLLFATINTFTLSGCATVNSTHGNDFNSQNVQKIINGETTSKELVQLFGEPFSKAAGSATYEIWRYYFLETTAKADLTTVKTTQKSKDLTVTISNDVVEYFTFTENANPNAGSVNAGLLPEKESEEVQPEAKVSVTQSEDTEAVGSSTQETPESTQASSLSLETSESGDQATQEVSPLAFTPPRSSKDSEWLYTATDDAEIEQFFGRSYTLIEKHLIRRRIDDCMIRKADFSACQLKAVKGPDQSHSMIEIREADGLSITRSHGFDEWKYQGTKVYIAGASKFLLAAIDQQVRRIKTQRLDLQVLLETPNPGEAIIWFGSDLKALERSLSDG